MSECVCVCVIAAPHLNAGVILLVTVKGVTDSGCDSVAIGIS